MTRPKSKTGMPGGAKPVHADAGASTPDTRHLDTAIGILRGSDKAKRGRPATTFTLEVFKGYALLQGARGKTVAEFSGSPEFCKKQAQEYAARTGSTLTINE
jgi:hypothetical protein